jgi:hypothetical protein
VDIAKIAVVEKKRVKAFWEKEYKAPGLSEPNPLAEFVTSPGFYDAQPITAARDEYEKYLRIQYPQNLAISR